jgi:hypothetical protein
MSAVTKGSTDIEGLLGAETGSLLNHVCKGIPKASLHLPGPDFVDRVVAMSDRTPSVMRSLQQIFDNGRLGGSGYVSILPVDQGIEHSAGASFAKNIRMFDPEGIVQLAIEGGCNAVASTRSAQQPLQDRQGLPRVGRPHRPGQPSRRDDRGRHHQAGAAGEHRRVFAHHHRMREQP